jgi:hypothetical protein
MLTEQGSNRTLTFVNQHKFFVFSGVDDCIRIFNDRLASNASIIASSQFGRKQVDKPNGYVFFWLKDAVENGAITVSYLSTGEMSTDTLTKPLSRRRLWKEER